jgi:membrane-associated phospholipid phosphatase
MALITSVMLRIEWTWKNPFDLWLLKYINNYWTGENLDWIFSHARETLFWMPLYLYIFLHVIIRYGKKGAVWILGFLMTAALSDLISSQVVKELVFRLRPCQDPDVSPSLRFFINYCPQSSSFTSSHATSHFAQAMFLYLTLRHTGSWWGLAFIWSSLIAYGQIYVGVHYPVDVIAGSLIGCIIGWAVSRAFHKQAGMLSS